MKINLALYFILICFISCNLDQEKQNSQNSKNETSNSTLNKIGDSSNIRFSKNDSSEPSKFTHQAVEGLESRKDSTDDTPNQSEERKRILKTYDGIKVLDSIFMDNDGDSLHFHLKYYCLKDDVIDIPSTYDWDKKNQKDFITYGFAADILLINNHDTVLKKQFKARSFNSYFQDNFGGNLKKYGSILMPELSKRNKNADLIVLGVNIAIPTTDIGTGIFLVISKNGKYTILEKY